MELSIVSEEYIMPSSPTPHCLRTHLLSSLDQVFPPGHVRIILLYPADIEISTFEINVGDIFKKRLGILKQSLSKTLSRFYPLAGRLKDEICIDCSDEGVFFVEANVKSTLSEVLRQPQLFHKLVPGGVETASFQATRFACGGMAIYAAISHKIVDASALSFFLRSWAATARDDTGPYQIAVPDFDGSTRFPRTGATLDPRALLPPFLFKIGSSVTKRFRFDAEAIAALKAKSCSSKYKQKPSRVGAVSALLCKSISAAMKASSGTASPIFSHHSVNVRRRAMPPLPESCMGNYVCVAPATLGIIDENTELSDLVIKLRDAINMTYHSDFIKCLKSEPTKLFDIVKEMGEVAADTVHGSNMETEFIAFNSWCNMGFYDVDFGWGKPLWVIHMQCLVEYGSAYMNLVFLMDTRSKDEVEAWITLDQQVMALLEQDKEFIAFATVEPYPSEKV